MQVLEKYCCIKKHYWQQNQCHHSRSFFKKKNRRFIPVELPQENRAFFWPHFLVVRCIFSIIKGMA